VAVVPAELTFEAELYQPRCESRALSREVFEKQQQQADSLRVVAQVVEQESCESDQNLASEETRELEVSCGHGRLIDATSKKSLRYCSHSPLGQMGHL
jgi:hypothetical protein